MSVLLPLLLLSSPASAEEVVLRNDTAFDDTFGADDNVAWLEFPECAISVLTPDPQDLPLTIDAIQFFFGSSLGNQDGRDTLVQLGIQKLGAAETPTGPGNWAWGEEAFTATVSSSYLNVLGPTAPATGSSPWNSRRAGSRSGSARRTPPREKRGPPAVQRTPPAS